MVTLASSYVSFFTAIFDVYGVSATLNVGTDSLTVTVIDRTKGVEVGDKPSVQTVRPVARIRMSELTDNGVDLVDLDGGTIEFNTQTWRIEYHRVNANSRGELSGTVDLFLMDEGLSS